MDPSVTHVNAMMTGSLVCHACLMQVVPRQSTPGTGMASCTLAAAAASSTARPAAGEGRRTRDKRRRKTCEVHVARHLTRPALFFFSARATTSDSILLFPCKDACVKKNRQPDARRSIFEKIQGRYDEDIRYRQEMLSSEHAREDQVEWCIIGAAPRVVHGRFDGLVKLAQTHYKQSGQTIPTRQHVEYPAAMAQQTKKKTTAPRESKSWVTPIFQCPICLWPKSRVWKNKSSTQWRVSGDCSTTTSYRKNTGLGTGIGVSALLGVWVTFLPSGLFSVPTPAVSCRQARRHVRCCHMHKKQLRRKDASWTDETFMQQSKQKQCVLHAARSVADVLRGVSPMWSSRHPLAGPK